MSEKDVENGDLWDRGWSEHKTRQLVRFARLPLAEKLAWLESAQAFVNALPTTRRSARIRPVAAGRDSTLTEPTLQGGEGQ